MTRRVSGWLVEFLVPNRNVLNVTLLIAWSSVATIASGNVERPTASQLEFFETRIRPVLVEP